MSKINNDVKILLSKKTLIFFIILFSLHIQTNYMAHN